MASVLRHAALLVLVCWLVPAWGQGGPDQDSRVPGRSGGVLAEGRAPSHAKAQNVLRESGESGGWRRLAAHHGRVQVATAGPPPEAIREAQELLAKLGYKPGPADGVWGRKHGAGLPGVPADQGQAVSDTLTPRALRAMRRLVERGSRGAAPVPDAARQQEEAKREQARQRQAADDQAFARAQAAATAEAYAAYLSLYPQGRHANEARRMQARIKEAESCAQAIWQHAGHGTCPGRQDRRSAGA